MYPKISSKKRLLLVVFCALLLLTFETFFLFSHADTVSATPLTSFVVNSLADNSDTSPGNGICADSVGNCTLRAAIQEANATGSVTDNITFALSGIIYLASALPTLTEVGTTIDGTGQSITITKAINAGHFNGFNIASNDNTIKNLTITGMTVPDPSDLSSPTRGNGIHFSGSSQNNTVTSVTISNNARDGIAMEGATFRFIGIVFSTIKDNGRNGITVIGNGTPFGRLSSYAAVSNITNNANIGISVTGAGFWVTGNTLDNNHTALHQANNSDFFVAYANNIVNHTLATLSYSGSGQRLIGHNWWGNYNVILDGLTNEEWSHRLGAPVIAWVDAYGNANLLNGHGPGPDYENPPLSEASLVSTTSSDIPVIISHGRNPDSAPFGNHITPDSENLCSDYYDFFVIDSNTTSGWTLTLPIDDDPDCINDVLNPKNLLRITDVSQCATPPAPTCWSFVPDDTITISGQKLVIANLTTAQLGGTPFVAGPKLAPTNTTLTTISAQTNSATSVYWFFAFVLLCLVSAGAMNRRF